VVKDKVLLSVKALNPKLADQIEILGYDWKEDGIYQKIWRELHLTDGSSAAKVHGWAFADAFRKSSSGSVHRFKYWLVQYKGQLFWYGAPDDDSELGRLHLPGMEQIFVG
jgi:hypothetical protein